MTIQKSRALAMKLEIFQSFQKAFMCPILFEFQRNLVKNHLLF